PRRARACRGRPPGSRARGRPGLARRARRRLLHGTALAAVLAPGRARAHRHPPLRARSRRRAELAPLPAAGRRGAHRGAHARVRPRAPRRSHPRRGARAAGRARGRLTRPSPVTQGNCLAGLPTVLGVTSMWRVSRVDKGVVRLVPDGDVDAPDDGTTVATARHGTLPMTVGDPVVPAVGDRVVLDGDRALVMPRTSELVRDTVGKTSLVQVIVANVDVVVVVEHLEPEPALGRLERMVTIAWRADATPLIVLTKSDLVDDTDHWVAQARAVAPGVDVVAVSATTGEGLDALHAALGEARTLVLVGPSGAGKSTLVNALAGHEVMRTGDVRGDGRGMHTTTHRE